MRRYLWMVLWACIGLLLLLGCRKTTTIAPVKPTAGDASRDAGQPSGTAVTEPELNPSRDTAVDPEENRHARFSTWWDNLSAEERQKFNQLPSEERTKKMREIMGE